MILTHGANSLKGGAEYLYNTDFSNFNVNTLKDGSIQWVKTGSNNPTVTLENYGIRLQFTNDSTQFNLPFSTNFPNLGEDFEVKIGINYASSGNLFICFASLCMHIETINYNSVGLWLYNLTNLSLPAGGTATTYGSWTGVQHIPYSFPLTYKLIVRNSVKNFSIYYEDTLVAYGTYSSLFPESFITFNNGGGDGTGEVQVTSISIKNLQ